MPALEQLDPQTREQFAQFLRGCKLCAQYYRAHVPDATSDDSSVWETPGIRDFICKEKIPDYLTILPTSTLILGVADHIAICEDCQLLAEPVVGQETFTHQMLWLATSTPETKEGLSQLLAEHQSSQESGGREFNAMFAATVSETELVEEWVAIVGNVFIIMEMMDILILHLNSCN